MSFIPFCNQDWAKQRFEKKKKFQSESGLMDSIINEVNNLLQKIRSGQTEYLEIQLKDVSNLVKRMISQSPDEYNFYLEAMSEDIEEARSLGNMKAVEAIRGNL